MVLLSGGDVSIGLDRSDSLFENEHPRHTVRLAPFYLDRTEVTRAAYALFLKATGHKSPEGWQGHVPPTGTESLPVTGVSWEDANAYAQWARKRLPTEEEWECAAGGPGGSRPYPWGKQFPRKGVNAGGTEGILPVGTSRADQTPEGIQDLGGNISEWTASPYRIYPGNPLPDTGQQPGRWAVRGGAFGAPSSCSRASFRASVDSSVTAPDLGFRCALSAKDVDTSLSAQKGEPHRD